MKIRLVGAELFHADRRTGRQTDMMKLIVALRNIAKAPTNDQSRVLEKAVYVYQTALRYITEDDIFRSYCHENIKSCIFTIFYCLQEGYLRIIIN